MHISRLCPIKAYYFCVLWHHWRQKVQASTDQSPHLLHRNAVRSTASPTDRPGTRHKVRPTLRNVAMRQGAIASLTRAAKAYDLPTAAVTRVQRKSTPGHLALWFLQPSGPRCSFQPRECARRNGTFWSPQTRVFPTCTSCETLLQNPNPHPPCGKVKCMGIASRELKTELC